MCATKAKGGGRKEGTIFKSDMPRVGLARSFSSPTGIARTHGKVGLTCPICGIRFERYAAWVRKVSGNCTCSRACAAEARKVRVITQCRVCGTEMELTPSNAVRVVTCSRRCSRLRRGDIHGVGEYIAAAKAVSDRGTCAECGSAVGPWVVRNLRPHGDVVFPEFDTRAAELWCRRCHLRGAAPLGAPARLAKQMNGSAAH